MNASCLKFGLLQRFSEKSSSFTTPSPKKPTLYAANPAGRLPSGGMGTPRMGGLLGSGRGSGFFATFPTLSLMPSYILAGLGRFAWIRRWPIPVDAVQVERRPPQILQVLHDECRVERREVCLDKGHRPPHRGPCSRLSHDRSVAPRAVSGGIVEFPGRFGRAFSRR